MALLADLALFDGLLAATALLFQEVRLGITARFLFVSRPGRPGNQCQRHKQHGDCIHRITVCPPSALASLRADISIGRLRTARLKRNPPVNSSLVLPGSERGRGFSIPGPDANHIAMASTPGLAVLFPLVSRAVSFRKRPAKPWIRASRGPARVGCAQSGGATRACAA